MIEDFVSTEFILRFIYNERKQNLELLMLVNF